MAYFVYSHEYSKYNFGENHPLSPKRYYLTYALLKSYQVPEPIEVLEPADYSEDLLELAHSREYIDFVKEKSLQGYGYLDYGDTPAFKGCFDAAFLHVKGTLTAVERTLRSKKPSFNIAGGYHHAKENSAGGFCIFNDIAIAVKYLREKGIKKIAVVDTDAHHGDGTQEILYKDSVLKIDIHESGEYLYPGTGFENELGEGEGYGYMINIPLLPYTGDGEYLKVINELVLPLLEWYKPRVIIHQLGVDTYRADPLTHMALSINVYEKIVEKIMLTAERLRSSYVVIGGGGYSLYAVPRVYIMILGKLAKICLSEELPLEWIKLYERNVGKPSPKLLHEDSILGREPIKDFAETYVTRLIGRIKNLLEEIHGNIFRS